jgi:hypothetical protein
MPYAAAGNTVSTHSSPASNRDMPSPRETATEAPTGGSNTSPKMASPTFAMSPLHMPSPPRPFDYTFGIPSSQPSALHSLGQGALSPVNTGPSDVWATPRSHNTESNGMLYVHAGSSQDPLTNTFYLHSPTNPSTSFDASFGSYDTSFDSLNTVALSSTNAPPTSTTPPYANFATPGLPFAGLDFIRNYNNPEAYGLSGIDDSLWQAIDPGAFHYDPDVPWSLTDLPSVVEEEQVRNQ